MKEKNEFSRKTHFVRARLSDEELAKIKHDMLNYGIKNISKYTRYSLLQRKIYVEKIDPTLYEIAVILSKYVEQIRYIGKNYNQVTKAIHRAHGTHEAEMLLKKLEEYSEKLTAQIAKHNIIIEKLEQKYDSQNQ